VLALAVDQQVVAVEDRVVAGFADPAGGDGDDLGPAGGEDVEAFVDAAAVARRPEFADRPAFAVRSPDREDVVEEFDRAVGGAQRVARGGAGDGRRGGEDEYGEEGECGGEGSGALQGRRP
jgi:hypothetical protein